MDALNAQQARQLMESAARSRRAGLLQSLYRSIENSAKLGISYTSHSLYDSGHNDVDINIVKAALEEQGYVVTRNQGYDPRDSEGWDTLHISW